MNCPHCSNQISHFSKAINKFGLVKHCPHCDNKIRFTINWKIFLIVVPSYMILQYYLLRHPPFENIYVNSIILGALLGIAAFSSFKLVKTKL